MTRAQKHLYFHIMEGNARIHIGEMTTAIPRATHTTSRVTDRQYRLFFFWHSGFTCVNIRYMNLRNVYFDDFDEVWRVYIQKISVTIKNTVAQST